VAASRPFYPDNTLFDPDSLFGGSEDFGATAGAPSTITGNLSVTEANDGLTGAASVRVGGVLNVTETADGLSGAASVRVNGVLNLTEAGDGLTGAAVVTVGGSLSATEANDALSGAATVRVEGALSIVEANDALTGAGTGVTPVRKIFSYTVAGDTIIWRSGKVRQASLLNAVMTVRFSDGTTKKYKNIGSMTFGAFRTSASPEAFLRRL
jgi:hypothetical protein